MAKGFPYFKFVATEWLTGDIVFEDFDVQGLFINICATYWHRNGQLTVEDINKRFKRPELLSKLIPTFITNKDGVVSISFLDEQLREANHISKVNSLNGSGGGRPLKASEKNLAIFYLLKCRLGDEEFYKAGITSESISRRFSNTTGGNRKIPYYFDVIFSVELNPFVALSLENDIRQNFERYTPKIKFSGHNECYIISDKILKHIEKYIATTETKATKTETKAKKSKEEEEREEEVKKIKSIYDTLVAEHGNDIKLISEFIKNHKPKFISPYIQLWNLFSQKYGVVKVEKASKTRESKIRVRLNEENFDFVQILKSAAKQKFALESRWFTFDWIIQNDTNYLKVLENKYTHQETAKQEDSTVLSAPKE